MASGVAVHRASVAGSDAVLASRLRIADTHWTRLRGLLGTTELPSGDGLWILLTMPELHWWPRFCHAFGHPEWVTDPRF